MLGNQDAQISRDEMKFAKFIDRVRTRFNHLFLEALSKQLVLKNIMTIEEWEQIQNKVTFNYAKDNFYEEQKNALILRDRLTSLQTMEPYIGRYFSNDWVRKHVLYQTEDDIDEMNKQVKKEMKDPLYQMQVDTEGTPVDSARPLASTTAQGPQPGGVSSVAPGDQNN
jgi:hypothetical protein